MIVGHEKITKDLKFLAKENRLAHGYIFFGPAMVGKRTVAISFANFLESGEFAENNLLIDCLSLSPSGGSLGIDAVRQIKNFLWQKPVLSQKRTVVLDGAENLTNEAQNALLKITEEPPPSALLLLITSDPDALSPTIFSRLQKIYFSTVSSASLAEFLEKESGLSKKTAKDTAEKSFGKTGLALAAAKDKNFKDALVSAKKLINLPEAKRRDFIKKLMEEEDFSLPKLLDFMILAISSEGFTANQKISRWHKFLELRHEAAYFNLNPRLQLESILNI